MEVGLEKKIDDLGRTFEEFKDSQDESFKLAAKGIVDAMLEEKIDKMNEAMSSLQSDVTNFKSADERVDEMEALLNRLGMSGGGAGGSAVLTAEAQEYKDLFNRYLRKGGDDSPPEELARKALLSTDNDPEQGWTVLPELDAEIARVQATFSAMRSVARVIPISSKQYEKLVNIGGGASGWVGEKASRTKTANSVLSKIIIEAMELYAMPAATQTLLDDSFVNIEMWLAEENGILFSEDEGSAFVVGDGVQKPRGFLDYDTIANASYTWGNIGFITTGANGGFNATNPGNSLIDTVYALRASYRVNGQWIMNGLTQAAVRKIRDDDKQFQWAPGLAAGQPATLLGYPVNEDENMPDIATNSLSIAFGDWMRGYTIADRVGVRVLRDPYTDKPNVLFYTTKRVGGGVTNFEAIKLIKFAA